MIEQPAHKVKEHRGKGPGEGGVNQRNKKGVKRKILTVDEKTTRDTSKSVTKTV
jgi:hypothetical protein